MSVALLTDLESVRQYLRTTVDQGAEDEDIEVLIEQVSDAIPRFCKREFTPTAGATRRFEFAPEYDMPAITINALLYELRAVQKVVLDPDMSGGVELVAGEWRLWPYPPSAEGTYWGIRLGSTIARPSTLLAFPSRLIDITGDWGTATVPDTVKRLANEAVAAWLQLPADGRQFNSAEVEGDMPVHAGGFPSQVRQGLKPFMRPLFPA